MQDSDSVPQTPATCECEECWTRVQGLRMRYLRSGSGPALILLHGLLGYSFSWRFSIPAFAKYRTVYAPDMPGAGFSERSAKLDCSFRGSALRVLEFADNIGLTSFDLLGTSHGGAVAMTVAAFLRERDSAHVRRLILVAPVNPWSAHGRTLAPFLSTSAMSKLASFSLQHCKFTYGPILRRLYGDPRRITPGTLEGYSRPYVQPGSFQYPMQILRTWMRDLDELERLLPSIAEVPTLLIWGSRDTAVYPESAPALARHFRYCELVEFPGVGHLPYEEVPEQFNAVVIRFLRATE